MDVYDICLNKDSCYYKNNHICFADINSFCSKQKTIKVKNDKELKQKIKELNQKEVTNE